MTTIDATKNGFDQVVAENTAPPISWAPQVIADNSGQWAGNALRFATKEEAEANVKNLEWRWYAVKETRVVPTQDPVTHAWKDGALVDVKSDDSYVPPFRVRL